MSSLHSYLTIYFARTLWKHSGETERAYLIRLSLECHQLAAECHMSHDKFSKLLNLELFLENLTGEGGVE